MIVAGSFSHRSLFATVTLLVREFVRRRTLRYEQIKRRLEARIDERTHELETLNRQLSELATQDALTGVANRRAMEHGLQREWIRGMDQRQRLGQRPLVVEAPPRGPHGEHDGPGDEDRADDPGHAAPK